jgi:hypothetical protein
VSIAAAYALLTSYGMKHHKEATDALLSGYMQALPLSKVEVCILCVLNVCMLEWIVLFQPIIFTYVLTV